MRRDQVEWLSKQPGIEIISVELQRFTDPWIYKYPLVDALAFDNWNWYSHKVVGRFQRKKKSASDVTWVNKHYFTITNQHVELEATALHEMGDYVALRPVVRSLSIDEREK